MGKQHPPRYDAIFQRASSVGVATSWIRLCRRCRRYGSVGQLEPWPRAKPELDLFVGHARRQELRMGLEPQVLHLAGRGLADQYKAGQVEVLGLPGSVGDEPDFTGRRHANRTLTPTTSPPRCSFSGQPHRNIEPDVLPLGEGSCGLPEIAIRPATDEGQAEGDAQRRDDPALNHRPVHESTLSGIRSQPVAQLSLPCSPSCSILSFTFASSRAECPARSET